MPLQEEQIEKFEKEFNKNLEKLDSMKRGQEQESIFGQTHAMESKFKNMVQRTTELSNQAISSVKNQHKSIRAKSIEMHKKNLLEQLQDVEDKIHHIIKLNKAKQRMYENQALNQYNNRKEQLVVKIVDDLKLSF